MLIKFFSFFLILLLIFFYSSAPTTMDKLTMSYLIVIVFISMLFFMFSKEKDPNLKGQFFKHSSFFLIGYFIVHFQYYFDYVLGNVSLSNSEIWINKSVVVQAMILSIIGLLCFFMGYFTLKKSLRKHTQESTENESGVRFLLILATISLVVFFYTVNPLYLSGLYGSEDMGVSATYAILIFSLTIYAVVIQNCRNMQLSGNVPSNFVEYIIYQGYFLTSLIIIYLLSVLLSGDRGPLITFGICFISGYFFLTKKKLSFKLGMLLIFAGAFFITLLGEVRNLDNSLSFSSKLKEVFNDNKNINEVSLIPQTQELAGSVRTLHTALSYIPEKHDFLYGRFQFQQIFVIIPFFNYFSELVYTNHHDKYRASSSFVTWINQGNFPNSGEGTSCIVDFYFDFGLIGVIIGMFFLGYFIRFFEVNMYNNEVFPTLLVHVFGVVYISNAFYISRSTFLYDLKSVFWIFVLLSINKKILVK